jgi:prevent-host-death family protein
MVLYKHWRLDMAVNLATDIKPISYIKTNAADMMKYVTDRRSPIVITQNGEARAVLVDIQTYQETLDAFALLNLIKIAEKDVQNGDFEPSGKVFSDLRKEILENG